MPGLKIGTNDAKSVHHGRPVGDALDVIRNGRIVATTTGWAPCIAWLSVLAPAVYEIARTDGTIVAVATVRVDGTWRIEGGRRNAGAR
ncbi:MAG: hypothetical protein ACYDCI_00300 [Candidatus Limnocylindrales bacterium]